MWWLLIGGAALYLYSKGQLTQAIQSELPVASLLVQDITGSPVAPTNQTPTLNAIPVSSAASITPPVAAKAQAIAPVI